ncbi:MAG: hypothetical protein MJ180_00910 [Candidatus Gastranaerophilales bacterium]|nr:hypothetical protein [Candidatus Gastranaerophilales bacterium]
MTNGIEGINAKDSYDNTLDAKYDYNKDGKVDIDDYHFAQLSLTDEDPTNDVDISMSELNKVFANIVDADDSKTAEDLTSRANTLLADYEKGLDDPQNAKSLLDLQNIGSKLTKYIKNCSDVATLLGQQITKVKAELDEIEEEKKLKEEEYSKKTQEVEEKSQKLSNKIEDTLKYADRITTKQSLKCDEIVRQSINEYKEGKYPNQTLQSIILQKLAVNGNSSELHNLQNLINENKGIGEEINSLCDDITNLVADIKDVTERYNNKNTEYNNMVNTRSNVLEAAQSASVKYQSGYQKRIDMRNDLVKKYSAAGGGLDDSNPQIQSLARFLQSGELNNMTFADAWDILSRTFTGIPGLSFNSNGSMDVPKGHSSLQRSVFDQLVSALHSNSGKTGSAKTSGSTTNDDSGSSRYTERQYGDSGYVDPKSPSCPGGVTRNDPISFTNGDIKYDFIIDRNNDGIFNDQSEFLGAKNGWAEMKAYDTNNDGHISGDELNSLQLVGINQNDGKFTYSSAKDAGIDDIDLTSYQRVGQTQVNNDVKEGTFKLTTSDGDVITGEQTNDTTQNLNNKYSFIYGTSTEDLNNSYENNPFMQEFKETLNTKATTDETKSKISTSELGAKQTVRHGEIEDDITVANGIHRGEREKEAIDKKAEEDKKTKEDNKKQEEEKKANKDKIK